MLRKQMYLKEREARKRGEYARQKKRHAAMEQQQQQQRRHRGGETSNDVDAKRRKRQREKEDDSDSSNEEESGDSPDEQDEENEARKRRVQNYYREKERRRQQEKEREVNNGKRRRGKNDDDDSSDGSDSSDGDSSSSSSSSDEDEEENNEDDEIYRKQMRNIRPGGHQPHRSNSEQDRREYENYLKQKRLRQEHEKKIDLRNKLQGGVVGDRQSMGGRSITHNPQPNQKGKMEKPAGYDERRRQREIERRKMLEPETRRNERNEQTPNPYENKRVVVRSKMYADKIMNSAKKPYDYNNRGRRLSRSPSDSEMNSYRRQSREPSETRKTKRRMDNRQSPSNDNSKRRKRRNSSNDRSNNDKSGTKNLKELEFRARALQSLLSKKEEETSRASRRSNKR